MYVVRATKSAVSEQDLRVFLGERLPAYMVPSIVTFVGRLPRNNSGKIDRRALPPIAVAGRNTALVGRDWVEDVLSSLVADVLGIPRISMTANFFELGGHSLLAAQVIARVRDAFGVTVPMQQMFDTSTLAQFSESVISMLRDRHGAVDSGPIGSRTLQGPHCVTFAQEHLWKIYQVAPRSVHQNITRAVELEGPFDLEALRNSFDALVARHAVLGATFRQENGAVIQELATSPTRRWQSLILRSSLTTKYKSTLAG